MHYTQLTKNQVLRFCRWSRAGYAIFRSLGRCVVIGRVCKSIADASLSKQTGCCSLYRSFFFDITAEEFREAEEEDCDVALFTLHELRLSWLTLPLQRTASVAAGRLYFQNLKFVNFTPSLPGEALNLANFPFLKLLFLD